MIRRPFFLLVVVFLSCLAALPACNKKKTNTDSGSGGDPPPNPPVPPAAVSSDYLVFAHVKVKDVLDSALFAEVKQAVVKAGAVKDWDDVEQQFAKETGGIKPTDLNSVTVCVTEFSFREEPKIILIINSNKPVEKANAFGLGSQPKADNRGFYSGHDKMLIHFPDNKTVVLLHPALAQKYLDGYAKNRTGWPMTAELTKAASGHLLFANVQFQKFAQELNELAKAPQFKQYVPLLAARTITLTGDLKGKEVSVAARVAFPDAAAADKAKETAKGLIKMATDEIEKAMNGKEMAELGGAKPFVQEAHRAIKNAKIEVAGSDLTIAGSYKMDFDVGPAVADAVKKIRDSASRAKSANNFKQVGLALINYADSHAGTPPIHATGPMGLPLKTAKDKPLLSWRVAILPYVEQQELYKQFKLDEPWDSEHNKKLIEKMPKLYAPVTKEGKPGYTHLQMVIGPNALNPVGMRFPASFPDGTSNTISVVEAADPVIWTKPDDVMLPGKEVPKDLNKKFGGEFSHGFNVALWDGSVRFISNSISDKTLSFALNPNDGQPLPSDW